MREKSEEKTCHIDKLVRISVEKKSNKSDENGSLVCVQARASQRVLNIKLNGVVYFFMMKEHGKIIFYNRVAKSYFGGI